MPKPERHKQYVQRLQRDFRNKNPHTEFPNEGNVPGLRSGRPGFIPRTKTVQIDQDIHAKVVEYCMPRNISIAAFCERAMIMLLNHVGT